MTAGEQTPGARSAPVRHRSAPSVGERMVEHIVTRTHRLRPADIPDLAREAAAMIGARDASVYLVDLGHRWLVPLGSGASWESERLSIEGTVAGRAFRTDQLVAGDEAGGPLDAGVPVWIPLVDGAERVGVLGLVLDSADEVTLRRCGVLATLLAEVIISRTGYGDAILLTRRLEEASLAAELRWSQLPPLTVAAPHIGVSGLLEPAYDIAGDAFDYAVNGDLVHVAIFDAMGHGLEASLMASMAVAAYRHARRRGRALRDLHADVDVAIERQFGGERFVTGQLAVVDARTGQMEWTSAGHPRPLLLRRGRLVGQLQCEPSLPLGLSGGPGETSVTQLEPGDRVLFYSDGVVEARSPEGDLFGLDRLGDLVERAAATELPLPEVTRRLVHSVLDHQRDRLQDDATVLLVEWLGPDADEPPTLIRP
jgi:hypothetical protein